MGTCSIAGCDKPLKVVAEALCAMHYMRKRRRPDGDINETNRHGRWGDTSDVAAYQRAKYAEARAAINEIKLSAGCTDCGYRISPEALHFDHLPGHEKLFNIGSCKGYPAEVVLTEIAKCEVVCANCHAVRTAGRRSR